MSTIGNTLAKFAQYINLIRHKDSVQFRYARQIMKNLTMSREEAREKQFRSLTAIILKVFNHSPFYRKRFQSVGFEPGDLKDFSNLKQIPPLTKTDIRTHLDEIVCDDFPKHQLLEGSSGGSTGIPVLFYRSKYCQDYRRAIDLALNRYYGWRDGEWLGRLWGSPRDVMQITTFKQKLARRVVHRVYALDVSRITDAAYEDFVALTKKFRPSFVLAYPSLAYDLAERIKAKSVSPIRIPVIFVTAEPLYDFQRELIESVLADKVYARYGAREFGTVAFECPQQRGYHIFTESVYIETEQLPGSDKSNVVLVTDLRNTAMPFIRYQVGDLAMLDEAPCRCGLTSPRMLEIQGRETDIIWRPDGSGFPGPEIVSQVRQTGMKTRVQVVQDKIDELTIRIEGKAENNQPELEILLANLKNVLGETIRYRVEATEQIERAPSGKYRYVICNVKRPGSG